MAPGTLLAGGDGTAVLAAGFSPGLFRALGLGAGEARPPILADIALVPGVQPLTGGIPDPQTAPEPGGVAALPSAAGARSLPSPAETLPGLVVVIATITVGAAAAAHVGVLQSQTADGGDAEPE